MAAEKGELVKRSRDELITLAKWAEKCERWDGKCPLFPSYLMPADCVDWVKQFSRIGQAELTAEERMLVAVAFKYYAGSRRAAWRVLSSIQKKENNKGASENVGWIKQYKATLEQELTNTCQDCLDLLTEFLIPNS